MLFVFVFFFKQKTAYEMRISDWSSDVCSSDLRAVAAASFMSSGMSRYSNFAPSDSSSQMIARFSTRSTSPLKSLSIPIGRNSTSGRAPSRSLIISRSEEHTSELQSLMRNSYAVFSLKTKKTQQNET